MRLTYKTVIKCAAGLFSLALLAAVTWQQFWFFSSNKDLSQEVSAYSGSSIEQDINQIFTGDLEGIRENKVLRILVEERNNSLAITPLEKQFIEQYAAQEKLTPVWIGVDETADPYSWLEQGKGDVLAAAKLAIVTEQQGKISFTLPWTKSRQQFVGRIDTGDIRSVEDLTTRQIALKPSSPIWNTLQALADEHPGMALLAIPEDLHAKTILARVQSGQYDLAVMDSIEVASYLPAFLELNTMFDFTDDESMVWGTRANAVTLHNSLNQFLNTKHLELDIARVYREDLDALKQRKLLRLITYQSPVNYFFDQGRLKGFEYELIKRFAKKHGMRLDVILAESHEDMMRQLLAGRGDIIAASLPTGTYLKSEKINYTQANNYAAPVLVGRSYDSQLVDIRDLHERRIVLPAHSPYKKYLERLADGKVRLQIIEAEQQLSTEAILFAVAQGIYDLTVIGSHELKSQFAEQLNLRAHFTITEPLPHSWLVREKDIQLLAALNNFISSEFRKSFYNVLYTKYIDKPKRRKGDQYLLSEVRRLSPYDEIVLKYAEDYAFDWRLIVAQMFQESQFDPKAVSYAGAEGLMQLLPTTAEFVGISELHDPDDSIYGGVRYMDFLRDRFVESDISLEDRTWFSLAAYNAGYSRLKRARNLAEKMNLDKNKWFDNVEKAMLALSRPYKKDGRWVRYCRCGQTVDYVRAIKIRYRNYVRLTEAVSSAAPVSIMEQQEI